MWPLNSQISLISLLSLFIICLIVFNQPEEQQIPISSIPTKHSTPVTIAKQPKTLHQLAPMILKETSLNWNLGLSHQQSSKKLESMAETLGGGLCAFDFNQDNWIDLFYVGGSGHTRDYGKKSWWHNENGNRLMMNHQGEYFVDVTEQVGLNHSIWGMGCSASDLNNDGHTDLIVTGLNAIHLFKNTGTGRFQLLDSKHTGIHPQGWSMGVSAGDFNQDGLLDLYISNFVKYTKNLPIFEQASGYLKVKNPAFDPTLYEPLANTLYMNEGEFKFNNVSDKTKMNQSLGRTLGARWLHLNADQWLDLIVINDQNSTNQVYLNPGFKAGNNKQAMQPFKQVNAAYAPFAASGARDLVMADFDNDQSTEFFMPRGASFSSLMLKKTAIGSTYTDTSIASGLFLSNQLAYSRWGAISGDFNNDGFIDIYMANGKMTPDRDSAYVTQAQKNHLFLNNGSGQFLQYQWDQYLNPALSSRGVISADLNNDGRLEIIVSNNNGAIQLFENVVNQNQNWIGLDLTSQNEQSESLGAVIQVKWGASTINYRVNSKHSFLSQNDSRIHIGLGNAAANVNENKPITAITIFWKDGKNSVFKKINRNQYYQVNRSTETLSPIKLTNRETNRPFLTFIAQLSDKALIYLNQTLLQAPRQFEAKNITKDILSVWHHSSVSAKLAILQYIFDNQYLNQVALVLVKESLLSDNIKLQIKAIELLEKAELEHSIAWLLPLLNHKQQVVQCRVANAFQQFFHEEEAITHKKTLALSPLIKLLKSQDDRVKQCAIKALASAESKRATLPLLKLAAENQSLNVRMASISALGFIRDNRSIPLLTKNIQSADVELAIVAVSLAALHRLQNVDLQHYLQNQTKKKRQSIIHYLSQSEDKIILDIATVKAASAQAFKKTYQSQQNIPTQADSMPTAITADSCSSFNFEGLLSSGASWRRLSDKDKLKYTPCVLSGRRLTDSKPFSKQQMIQLRVIFNSFWNKKNSKWETKNQLLLNLAMVDSFTANGRLKNHFNQLTSTEKQKALSIIAAHNKQPSQQQNNKKQHLWMKNILNNMNETLEVRLLAAKLLISSDEKAVFTTIYQQLITP